MSCLLHPWIEDRNLDFSHTWSGDSGVWGLKKNFALLELLERLQNGATNQSGMAEDALKGMGEVRKQPLSHRFFLFYYFFNGSDSSATLFHPPLFFSTSA